MVCIVHEDEVEPVHVGRGARRRALLDRVRIPGTRVLADRIDLDPGGRFDLELHGDSLGWFLVLGGSLQLELDGAVHALQEAHAVVLPIGCRAALTAASAGARLLLAEVPQATGLDPGIVANPPRLRIVDWAHEPVLDSKHDARRRIYVATPKLTGNKALKAEIIVYPPHTDGSNHHHEGAEHFMYVIAGESTGYSDEVPHAYKAGDLVYHPDGERHYTSTGAVGKTFIEFFVPAEYRTVWVDDQRVCTWEPTGRDSRGGKPSREIAAHDSKSAAVAVPEDL
jgi:quercetin dioxygenase-like cupin family protein